MTDFAGKKCLITGAASGIGLATAKIAAAEGAKLVLTDINADGLDAAVAEITSAGGEVAFAQAADVSDFDAVRELASVVHLEQGPVDIVMNIAGISTWGTVERLSNDDWHRVVEINLMGPIHVIECFIPPMIEAGNGGHLVNVSSAAGLFGLPWHAAYSASKFGLRGVSEVLRFDLRRHKINVSLVCPGGVETPLVGTVKIVGIDQQHPEVVKAKARFAKRAVSPEAAAAAIVSGVRKNRYMVFTSVDTRVGYWFQRKFAWPYELVMRALNREFTRLERAASR